MNWEQEKRFDNAYRATVVVAIAMVASVLMYAGIVEFLGRVSPAEPAAVPEMVPLLRQIFRGLALVTFLFLAWLGTRPAQSDGDPPARFGRLRSRTVLGLALAESIAIYGLVLFLLGRDPRDFYTLFAVSLLSFTVVFPRRDRWRDALMHP